MRSRLRCAPYGEAKIKFDPLPPMRLAAPFEALARQSDQMLKTSGARPKIFLANLGTAADFTARATFAKSFFETGGIEAIDTEGFADPAALAAAFKASGAALACLCSSDKVYADHRRRPPQRPFKTPAQGISIWQAGPASRKPRFATPASVISSLPAATRWRRCRTPGSGWSKHDSRPQNPF